MIESAECQYIKRLSKQHLVIDRVCKNIKITIIDGDEKAESSLHIVLTIYFRLPIITKMLSSNY